jgi:tetratricopeptide (TPR) repeat protein
LATPFFARRSIFLGLIGLLVAVSATYGQDEARAIWQVQRYDLNVSAPGTDRAVICHAVVTVKNNGKGSGATVTLRMTKLAEVTGVKVNDATADFRPGEEPRGNLQRLSVTVPSSPPNTTLKVTVDYKLTVAANSGVSAISPVGSQFLPVAVWYPTPTNPLTNRGPDTAPFSLTVTAGGQTVVSSGKASGSAFTQAFDGLPFFATGSWDVVDGAGDAAGISVYAPKGAGAPERKQADAMIANASAARAYFATLLGPAPDEPIRLVSVLRGGGFTDGGTLLLDAAAFRRSKIDSNTAALTAECVVRTWLGASVPVHGDGAGVIRDGLVHYLVSLFVEKQFGREAVAVQRQRERQAYVSIVRRDAPLTMTTPLEETYFNTVVNKGAMVWHLADQSLGREAFIGILRSSAQSGTGLTLAALRQALAERGGAAFKTLLDQELDQVTDLDIQVGLPQQRGADWVSTLRNLGSFDVSVPVVATTATGEHLTVTAAIGARNFGEAVFKTSAKITRVEVDPDKLYPQFDYTNDVAPRGRLTVDALAEAKAAFDKGDFTRSETIAREILTVYPLDEDARLRLARALLGENKLPEAEKEFTTLLASNFPSPIVLAWANAEMGELRMRQKQPAAAAKFYDDAVRSSGDYGATLAARAGRVKAESAAGALPVDESAKAFLANFDKTLVNGRRTDIEALVVPGELARFVSGVSINQPQQWQTQVLRTEPLDASHLAVDVNLTIRQLDKDASGTAVFVLAKVGGTWKLEDVQFFEVH